MITEDPNGGVEAILQTPDLAEALQDDHFKQFLDHLPVAIAVSELGNSERVVYANQEFERLTGRGHEEVLGRAWTSLPGEAQTDSGPQPLGEAVSEERDYLGCFTIHRMDGTVAVDVWSNLIEDDDGAQRFRLVALVEAGGGASALAQAVHEKDTQLRELQHRVKNNLQMITALIRVEARASAGRPAAAAGVGEGFDRLAGRIEALGLLYNSLGAASAFSRVDLGVYLSEIATAVMHAHAGEGVRLNLQVESWMVSIDVAMPAGLVVNELLMNALKHAFVGRDRGTISLSSTAHEGGGRVVVSDDGVGLPEGATWPKSGKLSALIVRSLVQNAHAQLDVRSVPGEGVCVTIDLPGQAER